MNDIKKKHVELQTWRSIFSQTNHSNAPCNTIAGSHFFCIYAMTILLTYIPWFRDLFPLLGFFIKPNIPKNISLPALDGVSSASGSSGSENILLLLAMYFMQQECILDRIIYISYYNGNPRLQFNIIQFVIPSTSGAKGSKSSCSSSYSMIFCCGGSL